jgi:DNA-binding NarL/FixJ family response regulator
MAKVHENDRILLIDHQPIYREGLRTALLQAGYPIVGEAGTAHQGLRVAEERTPGIAIIEARLPGINGFVTAAFMRRSAPWTKVVMIAHQITPALTASAIRVGAMAFLEKSYETDHIVEIIESVRRGINVLQTQAMTDEGMARLLVEYLRSDEHGRQRMGGPDLSPRELEVLDCLLMGNTNREIAEAPFITEQTVKNHMTSVMRKLDVNDRVAALRVAMGNGWSCLGTPALIDDPVIFGRR